MQQLKSLIVVFLLLFSLPALATSEDVYTFESAKQQQRFAHLVQELRCLVCQNQNLADSNAPLAQDLRRQVYQMVTADQSEQQVIEYLTARYGDFVLFRPPVKQTTYILWFAPLAFLLMGLGCLIYFIRSRQN